MSRGLSFEELHELLIDIEENHSWKNMYGILHEQKKNNRIVKYVRFSMDTRTSDIWWIKFDGMGSEEGKEFKESPKGNFKEEIYNWLKKRIN